MSDREPARKPSNRNKPAPHKAAKRGERPGRQPRNKKPQKAENSGPQQHAKDAVAALHRLVHSLSQTRGLSGEIPLEALHVPLRIALNDRRRKDEAAGLVAAVSGQIDEALKASGSWRQGRVFCFQCDQPDCIHARPPRADATFAGYTPTGKPDWISFTELCMRRQDERVQRVFAEPPEVIAVVQTGQELAGGAAAGFLQRGGVLTVAGQLVAGLLPEAYGDEEAQGRVALTVQVVQMPKTSRRGRFRLNLLGTTWARIADVLADEGAKSPAEGLRSALASSRHRLAAQSQRLGKGADEQGAADAEGMVKAVLLDLQRDIERVFRGHRWRTNHAEERHRAGTRPTDTAVNEASNAPTNRLMRDINRKTIVVLGRKGRAHVFSDEGRHVTSLQLGPGEAERKAARGRWKPLSEADGRSFRAAVKSRPAKMT